MNISGISSIDSMVNLADAGKADSGMTAPLKVLDMAQDVVENIASMLIESMSLITGIGQNIDIYA